MNFSEMNEMELNKALAKLLGECKTVPKGLNIEVVGNVENIVHKNRSLEGRYPDYCGCWNELIPIALEYGVYVKPLAWERTGEMYRAVHMALNEDSIMTQFGTKYISDDEDPARAIVSSLIKVLEKNTI